MVFGGGLVCGLVILAGWWLMAGKTSTMVPTSAPVASTPGPSGKSMPRQETVPAAPQQTVPAETPAPRDKTGNPAGKIVTPADNGAPAPAAVSLPAKELPAASTPVIREQAPATGRGQEADLPAPSPPDRERIATVPAENVAAVDSGPVAETATSVKAEIPLLADPDIKLQAITWSRNPEKRIAVINNRILRQGEPVSGYRVETINQDDVILSDREEKWKLPFRIK
jgi:hypothetical protein